MEEEKAKTKKEAKVKAHMNMASKLFQIGVIPEYSPFLTEEKEIIVLLTEMGHGNIDEEMLQQLPRLIILAGNGIRDSIQKKLVVTLLSVMSNREEKKRSAAAVCLESLVQFLPADELLKLEQERVIQAEQSTLWTIQEMLSIRLGAERPSPKTTTTACNDSSYSGSCFSYC